jgi:hypothetical protein
LEALYPCVRINRERQHLLFGLDDYEHPQTGLRQPFGGETPRRKTSCQKTRLRGGGLN